MDRRNAEEDMKVCEAATAPPWAWDRMRINKDDGYISIPECSYLTGGAFACVNDNAENRGNDAMFIMVARDALPHWIKRAKDAETELESLRDRALRESGDWTGRKCQKCNGTGRADDEVHSCKAMPHWIARAVVAERFSKIWKMLAKRNRASRRRWIRYTRIEHDRAVRAERFAAAWKTVAQRKRESRERWEEAWQLENKQKIQAQHSLLEMSHRAQAAEAELAALREKLEAMADKLIQ